MAVPNVPFWLSQANTEFQANGWASNIMTKAGLTVPGWASSLAGRSAATHVITVAKSADEAPMYGYLNSSWTSPAMGACSPNTFEGLVIRGIYTIPAYGGAINVVLSGGYGGVVLNLTMPGLATVQANGIFSAGSTNFSFIIAGASDIFVAKLGQQLGIKLTR